MERNQRSVPTILYRDDWIVVLDKQPGVLTHPHPKDRESPDCVALLQDYLGLPIHTIHRLDRAASGILLVALDPGAASDISSQFRDHEVTKHYLALVRGHVETTLRIDSDIPRGRNGVNAPAVSIVRPLCRTTVPVPVSKYPEAWYSLVEVELLTGRTHQARRHLHRVNYPIIGDNSYGDRTHNRYMAGRFGHRNLFLRSYRMEFDHPALGTRFSLCAGLSEWWTRALADLELSLPAGIPATASVVMETLIDRSRQAPAPSPEIPGA